MRLNRRQFTGLAVSASAVALGACAPGQSANDQPTTSPKSPGGSVDFKGKELTYVYFTDGPDQQAMEAVNKKFEEKTGAKVNMQIVPFADLMKQLQARLTGNTAPDVARVANIATIKGDLLDLKKFAPNKNLDKDFLPAAIKGFTGQDGELLAIPTDFTMNGPFINEDLFKKSGVALPTADKPWTWEEFVTNAKKVQKDNGKPYAIAMDKSGHRMAGLFSQFGTVYLKDGKNAFDVAKGTEALKLFQELHNDNTMPKDFWLSSGTKYKGADEIFVAQDAAAYISGNWQVAKFIKSAKFSWKAVPNPKKERPGGFPGGKATCAFKASKNPELAAAFVQFIAEKESQSSYANASQFLPTRNDLVKEGIKYNQRPEDMEVFTKDLSATPQDAFDSNYAVAFDGCAKVVVTQTEALVAGKVTPEAAAEAIKKGIDQAVADAKG